MNNKIFLILFIAGNAARAIAQQEVVPWITKSQIQTGLHFQMFQQDKRNKISQVSFPTRLVLPLSERFQLNITNSPAWTEWDDFGDVSSMTGISDTWVQGSGMFMDKQLFIHAGMGMPTGQTRLSLEELQTSVTMSQNFLKLTLPTYGQGFCTNIGALYSWPVEKSILFGAGIQYLARNEYVAMIHSYQLSSGVRNTIEQHFDPGDEFSINVGADFLLGRNTKWMMDGVFTYFGNDVLNGEKVFSSGARLILESGLFYRWEEQYIWAHLIYRYKGKNSLIQGLDFLQEEKNSNPFQINANFHYSPMTYSDVKLVLLFDNRFYGPTQSGKKGLQFFGFGVGTYLYMGKNNRLNFTAKVFMGQRAEGSKSISLGGGEVMINMMFTL